MRKVFCQIVLKINMKVSLVYLTSFKHCIVVNITNKENFLKLVTPLKKVMGSQNVSNLIYIICLYYNCSTANKVSELGFSSQHQAKKSSLK